MGLKPDPTKESYANGLRCGRQNPGSIANILSALGMAEKAMGTPVFAALAEACRWCATTADPAGQRAILAQYRHGLATAAAEGKLHIRQMWRHDLGGERHFDVLLAAKHNQLILSTYPDGSEPANVYGFDLRSGRVSWRAELKRKETTLDMCLGESTLYFVAQSLRDSDDRHVNVNPVCAIALPSGDNLGQWRSKKDDGGVHRIEGVFGKLLIVRTCSDQVVALSQDVRQEVWRQPCASRHSYRTLFFPGEKTLVMKNGDCSLVWLSGDGSQERNLRLDFGKKDQVDIDCARESEDGETIFLSVYGSWFEYNKPSVAGSYPEKSRQVFSAVRKSDAKIVWSAMPQFPPAPCIRILLAPDRVYFCREEQTVILQRDSGKILQVLPFSVQRVAPDWLCYAESDDGFRDDRIFYAVHPVSKTAGWQREKFRLLDAQNGLLLGQTDHRLLVLQQENGRELASVSCAGAIQTAGFIDRSSLWAISERPNVVNVFHLGDEG